MHHGILHTRCYMCNLITYIPNPVQKLQHRYNNTTLRQSNNENNDNMELINILTTIYSTYLVVSILFYIIRKRSYPYQSYFKYMHWALDDFNEAFYQLIVTIPIFLLIIFTLK